MIKLRAFIILAVIVGASTLAACGSSSSGVAKGCTTKYDTSKLNLVQNGELTVATDATYPPQESIDSTTHKFTGMEIDLIDAFASRLCLAPNINNVQFNTIITGITSSTPGNQYYDMSISAFTINDARQMQVDMIPYFQAGESLLVPAANPKHIAKLSDLCGLAVAVEAGTVEESDIKGSGDPTNPGLNESGGLCASNKVNVTSYDTEDQVIQQLLTGSIDAAYQDSPVSGYYAKQNNGKFVEVTTVANSPEGIVVRKDNAPFEDAIKGVLSDMRADGTYKSILDKWGLTALAYPPLS